MVWRGESQDGGGWLSAPLYSLAPGLPCRNRPALKEQPELKLHVVGDNDNAGGFNSNLIPRARGQS